MIKFLWFPNSPENEAKFLEAMKESFDLNSGKIQEVQDKLTETAINLSSEGKLKGQVSRLIGSKLLPALEMAKFSMSFRVLKKVSPKHPNDRLYYICGFTITPGFHEASFSMVSQSLGLEKFLGLFGFNYGEVKFLH